MAILYWTNEDTGALETFKFDATTSEDPSDVTAITDHPVEQGANIVDHARDEPERVTVEGIITNTPHQGNLTEDDDHQTTTVPLTVNVMTAPGTKVVHLDVPSPPIEISPSGLLQAGVGAIVTAITGGPSNNANVIDAAQKTSVTVQATVLESAAKRNRAREAYEKILGAKRAHDLITVQIGFREYFDMLIERVGAPRTPDDGDGLKFSIDLRSLRIAESQTVQSPEPTEARGSASKSTGSQTAKDDPNAEPKLTSTAFNLAHPGA